MCIMGKEGELIFLNDVRKLITVLVLLAKGNIWKRWKLMTFIHKDSLVSQCFKVHYLLQGIECPLLEFNEIFKSMVKAM